MKRREEDKALPKNVYRKGRSYYHVDRSSGKPKWTALGNLSQTQVLSHIDNMALWISKKAPLMVSAAKSRDRKFKRPVSSITAEDVVNLFIRCNGYCEVTGVKLVFGSRLNKEERPWIPSLDRIDCGKGYSFDNCRIVCFAANVAMADWGAEPLLKMLRSMEAMRSLSGSREKIVEDAEVKLMINNYKTAQVELWHKNNRTTKQAIDKKMKRALKREQCIAYLRQNNAY